MLICKSFETLDQWLSLAVGTNQILTALVHFSALRKNFRVSSYVLKAGLERCEIDE